MKPLLAIVSPCLDEENVLPTTTATLSACLDNMKKNGEIADGSFILFVDDGSSDNTWEVIKSLSGDNIRGLRLNRNCGHQTALLAGMEHVLPSCDMCITIDADLQDDVEILPEMVRHYKDGADVVYGVRQRRNTDSWLKRHSALAFYDLMHRMGTECVYNHGDFRLMSRRAMADLLGYEERNLFLRGLVPLIGYRQEKVYYERGERQAGKTKYPLRKMIDFAVDGITSFSVRPVRMLFWLGVLFTLIAIGIGVYTLIRYFDGETLEGWTSLMLSIWFCTGVLLMGLGIIGEYVGKIYIEVKKRPRYRISDNC